MLQKLTSLLAVAAAMLLATACKPIAPTSTMATTDNPLSGTSWILTELNGQPALAETTVTLNFGDAGTASGNDGCNSYRTTYKASGDAIQFSPNAAATLMACPEPIMQQATTYYTALTDAANFKLDGSTLVLSDNSGGVIASFSAQSTDLAGTAWDVIALNNGNQAVTSTIAGTTLTAEFSAEGALSGSGGCNRFAGSYSTDGKSKIEIGPLLSTMMACISPEGVMEQEAQYTAALQTAVTYRIDGDRLELRTADGALAVQFQRGTATPEAAAAAEGAATTGVVVSPATSVVTGTVIYLQRSALPDNAMVEITIRNASLADAPPEKTLLAMTAFTTDGRQVPLPYAVAYEPTQVETGALYSIGARITDSATGKLLFISTTAIPVITKGNPTQDVEILVRPVK